MKKILLYFSVYIFILIVSFEFTVITIEMANIKITYE